MDRPLLFGKYCLLERISVGGMAEVFRAKPLNAPDPGQYFAVKRILPHLAEDVEFIKMFVDEARLTVQLDHPNIVDTYELGQFQSSHYIVMEFIAGKDLLAFQKHVRNKGTVLDVNMACHIMRKVAKGLDYAHNKTDEQGDHLGIIHRDVSPQNVLVSWDGRVRIIDFGIAKATTQSTKTRAGVMKGKFGYMSPEQVQGEEIDHRSDIFAMGTLLWELLTNRRLFKAGNQLEAMTMISEPDVDPPSAINEAVPAEVDDIVMKMLEADPNDRYHWGEEVAEDIKTFLTGQHPPFHYSQLTSWVRDAFREDFEEERRKREQFRQINTAEDVRRKFDDEVGEAVDDEDEERSDATDVWDVDEAPDSDADIENFVTDHTVVQAGGLDLAEMGEWDDAPDTIDETREVVQARIDETTYQHDVPDQLAVEPRSDYEAEPTEITDPDSTQTARPKATTGADTGRVNTGRQQRVTGRRRAATTTGDNQPVTGDNSRATTTGDNQPVVAKKAGPTTDEKHPPVGSEAPAQPIGDQSRPPGQLPELPDTDGASSADSTVPDEPAEMTPGTMTVAPTPPKRGDGGTPPEPDSTGLPPSPEPSAGPGRDNDDGASVDKSKVVGAAAAVTTLVALGLATAWVVTDDEVEEPQDSPDTGQLHLQVEPAHEGLSVFVDDRWVGDEPSVQLEGLEPDRTYSVQVNHPDHLAWQRDVELSPGEITELHIDLMADAQLEIRWEDDPEQMQLFVDAEPIDLDAAVSRKAVELPRGMAVVEGFGSGVRPIRRQIPVDTNTRSVLELDWTPNDEVELKLDGEDEHRLVLDEEDRGQMQLPVDLLLRHDRLAELEIAGIHTQLGYPIVALGALHIDDLQEEYDGLESHDYGELTVDTGDMQGPWQLVIDDVETSLVVPHDDIEQIPVLAGERRVGFQRGDRRHEYRVRVDGRELTLFRPDLQG